MVLLGTALDNITKRGLGVAGEGVSEGLEETASSVSEDSHAGEDQPGYHSAGWAGTRTSQVALLKPVFLVR